MRVKQEKPQPQAAIGKYPVIREIGSGATSRVYLARDPFAERDVAIKVLEFIRGVDQETERMVHKAFVAEASLAGKLAHPHIVEIYDAVVEPDYSYLVMEYVPGSTLEAHSGVSTLLPPELNGVQFLADMWVDGLVTQGAEAVVPDAPGLGITVDEAAIREHALSF